MTILLEKLDLGAWRLHTDSLPLSQVGSFLDERVLPMASELDVDSAALFGAFEVAAELRLLTPKMPEQWNGAGLSGREYQQLQSMVAARSGALTFLLSQHQSAASFILASENEALKAAYLPGMATGEKRIGVGFSHLRRRESPLRARRVNGGYLLSGEVPWVTGAGLFEAFVGGAALPNGESVFGLLPLADSRSGKGELLVSRPMDMASMAATRTVRISLKDWFVADEQVLGLRPAGWLRQRDITNPLSPIGMILGCAVGACYVLAASLRRREISHRLIGVLVEERTDLIAAVEAVTGLPKSGYSEKMALRGRAIAHMNKCAQAAMMASGGAANAMGHPARRVYGEALVFSVSGQTNEGAIASLDAID